MEGAVAADFARRWTRWLLAQADDVDTLRYHSLGTDEGVSQSFVTAIAQDGDGFHAAVAGGLLSTALWTRDEALDAR